MSEPAASWLNRSIERQVACVLLAGLLTALLGGCRDPQPSKQELVRDGNRLYWSGSYLEALGPYSKADAIDPGDAEVKFRIGQCYFYLHSYREAIRWYRDALKSNPALDEASAQLAEAKRRLPNLTPAESPDGAGPAAVNTPNPRVVAESYISLARTWEQQNEPDRALENYKKAVEAADDQAFTHAALGRFYLRAGRNAEAEEQLKIAQKLNPTEPGVAEDLARLGGR